MSQRRVTLGELCTGGEGGIQTGPFGSQLHAADYVVQGIPLVMPKDIGDNSIDDSAVARVSAFDAERLGRHRLRAGDIVFSRRGDVGKRAWVRPAQAGWLCGTGCLLVRVNPAASESRFISYALGQPEAVDWIRQHAVGATMLNLNTGILAALPLCVPEPAEQRGIAEVLGALDDKIAANELEVGQLDKLARGRFRALQEDPDAVVWSVADLVEVNPRCLPAADPAPYVDMQKLPTATSLVREWDVRSPAGGARFQNGDTLLARITPCLENGKTAYVDFLADGETGVGSTEFVVLRSRAGVPASLSYLLARDEDFRTFAIQNMVGTSGRQRVAGKQLYEHTLRLPEQGRLSAFGDWLIPVFELLAARRNETRTLAELRDTLLPELMSGRLTVQDAERTVGEVL